MNVNIIYSLACVTAFFGLMSIISVGCGLLVKMFITLEPQCIFGSNFTYFFILHCPVTSMQDGDKALLRIIW